MSRFGARGGLACGGRFYPRAGPPAGPEACGSAGVVGWDLVCCPPPMPMVRVALLSVRDERRPLLR